MKTENTRVAALRDGTRPFLVDSGLETWMSFVEGFDLPLFGAFHLLGQDKGRTALRAWFLRHIRIAQAHGTGFVLDTVTWRASQGWGHQLGLTRYDVALINIEAARFAATLRHEMETPDCPMPINGVIGPRGDGYILDAALTPEDALAYHRHQAEALRAGGVDMLSAITMTHTGEAIGIALAAAELGLPCVISFTVETDGRLPSGETLADAIAATDAATGAGPLFYMVNCAHPSHFRGVLSGDWLHRIGGIRANASCRSHAELEASETLDAGDPLALAEDYAALDRVLPNLRLRGGCCGTDHRHIEAIAARHAGGHADAA
ncbi:homocysteine S-methyltransferase [Halovulum dunhuangense]|uniref:Homocysteine S-methyltransferase n=1 Tax=Halovulum dunhuangense TaxID=1505036 RepID=A0A849L3B9_9RHOB|nr:homocysteine S-methyltransferase family protein [Halovulum dunhuangense]NNU80720.1 homocysteine S-methyltransferase [Halovulum dunhuangense]